MRTAGFDVVRGTAIGLVLLRHALPVPFGGAGVVGVVMFFALSGYLITGLLVEELERDGRIDLGAFYRRRARRLVPALVALLVGWVVVTATLDPAGERDRLLRTVVVAATWTADLPFAHPAPTMFHLWTLAVEEQFYLIWPAVLALAFVGRRTTAALLGTGLVCAVGTLATVIWLASAPDLAYVLPTSWAGCFVIGAAARIHADRLVVPRWAPGVALAALGVLSMVPLRGHALTYLAGGPAIAALTAVLLTGWRGWQTAETTVAVLLVRLGTISYAAYLWNYPLTLWLRPHVAYAGALAVLLTLVVAAASWRYVEKPLLARHRVPA